MKKCIFCSIADGTLPAMKLYEDEHSVAFMDTAGDVDGHILVVPKIHTASLLDCPGETLSQLMKAVKRVALHLTENCGYEGVNLLNASGESAGQSVQHFHIHIVPRRSGDGVDAWPQFSGAEYSIEDVYSRLSLGGTIMPTDCKLSFEQYDPSEDKQNCVVRAMAKLTGKDYPTVKKEMTALAERSGFETFNDQSVFEEYMSQNGIYKERDYNNNTQLRDLDLSDGSYCVLMTNRISFFHVLPVVDNVIYDRRNNSLSLYVLSTYKKAQ